MHEKDQAKRIRTLEGQISILEEKLNQSVNYYDYDTHYDENSYNYLAIGNSLTLIESWGRGICSTQPDNDYYGLVIQNLKGTFDSVVSYRYNFAAWEISYDRDEALSLLDKFLDSKLNLVTIQLGENVSDRATYEQDLEELVNYVKAKSPNARIVIIGDFWDIARNNMRKEAARNTDVVFADIAPIINNKDYQSKAGVICYLEDGNTIEVSKEAETHPNDAGMKYIAEKVIEKLKY